MKVNGPGRSKSEHGRNSWQWAKHAWRYSDLLLALKGKHFVSPRFSKEGTFISARAVRHRVRGWGVGGGGGGSILTAVYRYKRTIEYQQRKKEKKKKKLLRRGRRFAQRIPRVISARLETYIDLKAARATEGFGITFCAWRCGRRLYP